MAVVEHSATEVGAGGKPAKRVWAYALLAMPPIGFLLGVLSSSQPINFLVFLIAYVVIVILDHRAIKETGKSIGLLAAVLGLWLPPFYFYSRSKKLKESYTLFWIAIAMMILPIVALSVLSVF